MSSNVKKSETLGMPHGTATHRLRKNVLFHLLKKYGENHCFKCQEMIETVDELSIEHKKPWEGVSAELFWDLENIAFSHLRCNIPHIHSGGGQNKIACPEGFSWCRLHKAFLPIRNFSKDSYEGNGLRKVCKEHQHYYRDSTAGGMADVGGLNPPARKGV